METPSTSVFLIDDSPFMVDSLTRFFATCPEIRYLGHSISCVQGEQRIAELDPDVVLLDAVMPNESTVLCIRRLRARGPRPGILMLSGVIKKRVIEDSIAAGAWGYLSKDVSNEELVRAIQLVAMGSVVFSSTVRRELTQ